MCTLYIADIFLCLQWRYFVFICIFYVWHIPSAKNRKLYVTNAMNSTQMMSSQNAKHRVEHTNRYHDAVFVSWKLWNSFSSSSFAWNARTVDSPCSVAFIWLYIGLRPNNAWWGYMTVGEIQPRWCFYARLICIVGAECITYWVPQVAWGYEPYW